MRGAKLFQELLFRVLGALGGAAQRGTKHPAAPALVGLFVFNIGGWFGLFVWFGFRLFGLLGSLLFFKGIFILVLDSLFWFWFVFGWFCFSGVLGVFCLCFFFFLSHRLEFSVHKKLQKGN